MRRITFITGYFGSGKTEMSLNLAMQKHVGMLIDLDVVNPYFRSREFESVLLEQGIITVSSSLKNTPHLDMPFMSKDVYIPFRNEAITAIYDLGGSGSGARLLRQFKDDLPLADVDLLFCVNVYREVTDTAAKIIAEIETITESGGMRPTGLINNSNFMKETTYEDILVGQRILTEVTQATGLPIVYTGIVPSLDGFDRPVSGEKILLKLYMKKQWL